MAITKTTVRFAKGAERSMERMAEAEEMMEKETEETIVNVISNEIKSYMHQEHIFNAKHIKSNGFIGRAISRAGFTDLLNGVPQNIYPVAVVEFLGYFDSQIEKMKVTTVDPRTHGEYHGDINV